MFCLVILNTRDGTLYSLELMLSPKFEFRPDTHNHLDCSRVFAHSPRKNAGLEPEKEPVLEGSGRKD